jgi:hypothetical protein
MGNEIAKLKILVNHDHRKKLRSKSTKKRQDKTRQDKTRLDQTRQDKTGQNSTRQDKQDIAAKQGKASRARLDNKTRHKRAGAGDKDNN